MSELSRNVCNTRKNTKTKLKYITSMIEYSYAYCSLIRKNVDDIKQDANFDFVNSSVS